jgi:hypothetical protein
MNPPTNADETAAGEAAQPAAVDPGTTTGSGAHEELPALIERAFELARERKPQQWRTMTLAVLKNRLLQLTDRSFRETDYGVRTMRELAGSLPELLAVDDSARPPTVTWLETPYSSGPQMSIPKGKIRSDLWNAVMDYKSGRTWMWVEGRAVPDPQDLSGKSAVLPTLDADEMQRWRNNFAAAHREDLDGEDAERLEAWTHGPGKTLQLPLNLRSMWNEQLKAAVIDRLRVWFETRDEVVPQDVVVSRAAQREAITDNASDELRSLRDFIIGCISLMNQDELDAVTLPAKAAQRYMRRTEDLR